MKTLRKYQQYALKIIDEKLKDTVHPVIINASVGAGKSLIIAELLLKMEKQGLNALCLTASSTLIEQNAETYKQQGGAPGIYCAMIHKRETKQNIIFASPNSVSINISNYNVFKSSKNNEICCKKFNLIVIDEVHNVNYNNKNSMYMRILTHYGMLAQTDRYNFRVLGLTGTPYRGKSVSIVGEDQYFKETICTISMPWLINQNFLVRPVFEKPHVESFDTSSLRVDKTGKFKHKALEEMVQNHERLTGKIMREIVSIIESGRTGAFIFASTVKHAQECMRSLPAKESYLITAETSHEARTEMLEKARTGIIKYLVNVSTLLVGVDVPNFDVCAWLRPTESLIIFTQGIGRVLRLSPGKKDALILDYAQNLERHGDIDDPVINQALQSTKQDDPDYCIKCYTCNTMNKITARRCIGLHNEVRCEYYFEFKECKKCNAKNDRTSRYCRGCDYELINPNDKLEKIDTIVAEVVEAKYDIILCQGIYPLISVSYKTRSNHIIFESYLINSERGKHIFYGKFIKKHFSNPSHFYPILTDFFLLKKAFETNKIITPHFIHVKKNKSVYELVKKIFN